jgi:oxygen-independent coproporphyrinogen III oxidase
MIEQTSYSDLLRKYDVPVPRYTSYPTVPYWDSESFDVNKWKILVKRCFDESNNEKGISIYIHLPFCESLCTYCACNTRITKNHAVEKKYTAALLAEWQQYLNLFEATPIIRELHLGGGTPTFFSPENLAQLIKQLLSHTHLHPMFDFSFEGHPTNTSSEHLQVLHKLGFRRVSYGVQDLELKVQHAINRIQPFEAVKEATIQSRLIGYDSVNFDLIYGLPHQSIESITQTITKVISLRPDRIAFYSYAHVPWLKPGQRGYEDADLPCDVEKRALYEHGKYLLEQAGYVNIGMDHFALPTDALAMAHVQGRLHRNFMGYTVSKSDLLIGLGASSISDVKYAYAQNEKKVESYYDRINRNNFALFKGHILSEQDQEIRKGMLMIACQGFVPTTLYQALAEGGIEKKICTFLEEGILVNSPQGFEVTELGLSFLRNICSVFDLRMQNNSFTDKPLFSRSV